MKLNSFNKKLFGLSLVFTSICSGCKENKKDDSLISYNDLVNNYKIVEFDSLYNKSVHIVKKEAVKDMPNCYGYYDIYYHKCIVKVDDENGYILGKGIINNIVEMNVNDYLEKYDINQDSFSTNDLDLIIEMVRENYFDKEKVLVK